MAKLGDKFNPAKHTLPSEIEKLSDAFRAGRKVEHDKIYALYTEMFESHGEFTSFSKLGPRDIMHGEQ